MIRPSAIVAFGALAVFAVEALAQPAAPLDVRSTMQNRVNPAMLEIWDVGNNAMNDDAVLDAKLMDDAKWARIGTAAGQLAAASRDIAAANAFISAAPDNQEVGEGEIAMAAVQQHLDHDPAGIKQMAEALADHADRIAAAARAKDATAAGELIGVSDQVCEACHMTYWYPE
jgi:cytochrome c556